MSVSTIEHEGARFYTKLYTTPAPPPPLALVIFVHGFAEHIDRYDGLFTALSSHNLEVFAYDQRGFGKTAKQKSDFGHTGGYDQVLEDLDFFITKFKSASAHVPIFLYGHSMGGGIVINYAIKGKNRSSIAGIIASGPLIKTAPESSPNFIKLHAGRIAALVLPGMQLDAGLRWEYLTRDPKVNQAAKDDPLVNNIGTLRGIRDMLDAAKNIESNPEYEKIEVPCLFLHGSDDKITSHEATRDYYTRVKSKDKEFKSYPGYYHEIHLDIDNGMERVSGDIRDWIKARL